MKVKIVVTHLLTLADILRCKIIALVDNPSYAIIFVASLISSEDNSYLCHSISAVNNCDNSSNASFNTARYFTLRNYYYAMHRVFIRGLRGTSTAGCGKKYDVIPWITDCH